VRRATPHSFDLSPDAARMLLQQPAESPYDVRFNLFGFFTRISWTFWLVAVVLGYDFVQLTEQIYRQNSPGRIPLLIVWVAMMAISILIHELGHAIAFRRFGFDSSIVLYYLGGLASPTASFRGGRSRQRFEGREEVIVAAAGPVFQIGSAIIVIMVANYFNYRVVSLAMLPGPLSAFGAFVRGREFENAFVFGIVNFYVWPSIAWGILNLLPVLPLDGGRICKGLVEMQGGATSTAIWISVVTAAVVAVYAFNSQQTILAIFFASMAISNYQTIQPSNPW